MFRRWLSYQQPLWLVATFFMIGVAIESQANYHKKTKMNLDVSRDHSREGQNQGRHLELAKESR